MIEPKEISTQSFNYTLPETNIAHHPLAQRDASRLLEFKNGTIHDHAFTQLPSLLSPSQTLVFNNTKVIRARILCQKQTGANIEIFCLEPIMPSGYEQMFASTQPVVWKCITGNLKKWKGEDLIKTFEIDNQTLTCNISLQSNEGSYQLIQFSWTGTYCFAQILQEIGQTPIPPYFQRAANEEDTHRYQTVYAQLQGSVAAPTAGLHFTTNILGQLKDKGINTTELTLHVGAGTFKPMKSETLGSHEMHTEHCIVTQTELLKIVEAIPSIVAVGTTSVRTLESLYWIGVKLLTKAPQPFCLAQWELYETLPQHITAIEALQALCQWMTENKRSHIEIDTCLMIVPGYRFRTICGLITNFHQPQSTLLLLVAAAIGKDWQRVYQHAIAQNYRFLSYGDSSLLWISQ